MAKPGPKPFGWRAAQAVATVTCPYCGEKYRPRIRKQKTCGKTDCQAARNAELQTSRDAARLKNPRRDDLRAHEIEKVLAVKRTRLSLTEEQIWGQRPGSALPERAIRSERGHAA